MKNKIAIIILLLCSCLLVGCQKDEPQNVKQISRDFTVSSHIKSDYLYQQSSKLLITGQCEVGGTLIATLYSHVGAEVSSQSVVVSDSGKYKFELNTPNGSFNEYSLEIRDYHNKYVKTYTNLLFGEVHLLLGDHLVNDLPKECVSSEEALTSLYYLDCTDPTNSWYNISSLDEVDSFSYYLYEIISSTYKYSKVPIGFAHLTFETTLIEEWLPLDYAMKSSSVIDFLKTNDKYYENPYQIGQMSYVSNNLLSSLYKYSFSTINLSLGVNEFNDFYGKHNSENQYNFYAKMLLNVLRNIEDNFYNYNALTLIQANSVEGENINVLRNIQAQVSNYMSDLLLIPTYDLFLDDSSSFNEKLSNRYYNIVYGKKDISEYANHFISENEHIITIELSKSTIFDFNFDNIKLYDQYGKEIVLKEGKIKDRFNQIIIDLSYGTTFNGDEDEEKILFYEVSRIEYAQDNVVSGGLIYNNNDLPVIPFIIEFE